MSIHKFSVISIFKKITKLTLSQTLSLATTVFHVICNSKTQKVVWLPNTQLPTRDQMTYTCKQNWPQCSMKGKIII